MALAFAIRFGFSRPLAAHHQQQAVLPIYLHFIVYHAAIINIFRVHLVYLSLMHLNDIIGHLTFLFPKCLALDHQLEALEITFSVHFHQRFDFRIDWFWFLVSASLVLLLIASGHLEIDSIRVLLDRMVLWPHAFCILALLLRPAAHYLKHRIANLPDLVTFDPRPALVNAVHVWINELARHMFDEPSRHH